MPPSQQRQQKEDAQSQALGDDAAVESDLTRLRGIGPELAGKLCECGVRSISDLARLSESDMAMIEQDAGFKGRMARDDWIAEARDIVDREGAHPAEGRDRGGAEVAPAEKKREGRERDKERERVPPKARSEWTPFLRMPAPRQTTHAIDKAFKAQLARASFSITPAGLASNAFDWMAHMAISPGKQLEVMEHAGALYGRYLVWLAHLATDPRTCPCFMPLPDDDRFEDERWQEWPFNVIHQSFLMVEEILEDALTDVEGVPAHEQSSLAVLARQLLDHVSPSNFVMTNPEVLDVTLKEGGLNLVRGLENAFEDLQRFTSGQLPVGTDDFVIGEDLAATEGKVIFRNHLIELIQYTPKTDKVHPEPILITPAWIMKYYILDLSPENSLVKFLVENGYTVFMISWRTPTAEDRDLGMNDYLRLGIFDALKAVNKIVSGEKVHAIGYCIGGTLLTIAAAAMARDGDERLKSITLFAAQTDFTDAGEIMLFVNESQVSYLESLMWDQGYLDSKQMAGAFQMLRSNDLIWSRYIHEYLLGKRQKMIDLMAWNADATRMPYRMHSEYLRRLFLNNDLAQGRFVVGEDAVSITDIRQPIFAVSTTKDHVAPWRSVYKIHLLADTDITFVLANRGHNGGIVSEPGHKGRKYQIRTTNEGSRYIPPDDWRLEAPEVEGSWWLALIDWLDERSGEPVDPPRMGAPERGYPIVTNAPGTYVHQR